MIVCPLNWGLGHAARDIPIIRLLKDAGHRVIVATDPKIEKFLSQEFPDLEFEYFPGPKINYTKYGWLLIPKLLFQIPTWIKWYFAELKMIAELVKKHHPKCIISDNRYGARHRRVKSIIITHQLMLKMPNWGRFMEYPVHRFIKFMVEKFDECWIPDNPSESSLSGDLAFKYPLPKTTKFTGALSDFMFQDDELNQSNLKTDILVMLSGPEPQKTMLEMRLYPLLKSLNMKIAILRGEPELTSHSDDDTLKSDSLIQRINHLPRKEIKQLIKETPYIIARAGYTSIMDLWFVNKSALLIPTPGQTEQVYLSEFNRSRHFVVKQNAIDAKNIKKYLNSINNNDQHLFNRNNYLEFVLQSIF